MEIKFMEANRAFPNGYLQINDARIIWKNFTGRGDRFNREGERNFSLVVPTMEDCEALRNDTNKYGDGWNVKIKPPREEGDVPFMHMPVKVKFNNRGPNVYLVPCSKEEYQEAVRNGNPPAQVRLSEDTIKCLDDIDILSVDMDVRPYDGEMAGGNTFRAAYLSAMRVYQRVDRFLDNDYLDF
jgi:hypothetical protein